jgi:hypothetical protein
MDLKKYIVTIHLILLPVFIFAQAPQLAWAFGIDQMQTNKVICDAQNNIYGVGMFNGTIDIDPGTNVSNVTSNGQQDIFIVKYNSQGALIWFKTIGGTDWDTAIDVHFDNIGNLVIVGDYNLTVDFNPSASVNNQTSLGIGDFFILKLDSNGNYIDSKSIGGTGLDHVYAVEIDQNNNVYLTGVFANTVDFNTGITVNNLGANNYDTFVLKLDGNLNYVWAKCFYSSTPNYGSQYNRGLEVFVDDLSNVHVVGYFVGTVDFDPGNGTSYLTTIPANTSPQMNIFYAQLSSMGNFIRANQIAAYDVSAEMDSNFDILIAGKFYQSNVDFDFNAGYQNLVQSGSTTWQHFLLKINKSGDFIWVKNMGGDLGNITPQITVDNQNNILYSSNFGGTSDFDPSTGVLNLTATGSKNVFLTKLSSNGNFNWAVTYGALPGSNSRIYSITCDESNAIISVGNYGNSGADMDPSSGNYLLSDGAGYYQKLSTCSNSTSSLNLSTCNSYTAPDGQVYNQSGSYSATIPNALGCDSVITINLTVNPPTSSTISPSTCYSYTAPDGQVYTQSGNYTATIPNTSSCDSLITINLTIHQNTTSSISPTSCSSYVAPDGQIYTQSGTYNATIPNVFGCDSLITINLTIQNVDTVVSLNVNTLTANSTGAQYQWIDCATNQPVAGATQQSFTPTYNGNFAVIITNGNCSDTSSCTSVSHVSLHEITSSTYSVQPNPTTGIVTLIGLNPSVQNRVMLYTISGEKIAEFITAESEMELNLGMYAPGIYLINYDGQVLRIIKEK